MPPGLAAAADISWRLLVVAAAVAVAALVLSELRLLALAIVGALFATALLRPPVMWLRGRGWGSASASAAVLISALGVLAGIVAAIVPPFVDQLDELGSSLRDGVQQAADWLIEGPLGLSEQELDAYVDQTFDQALDNSEALLQGVFSSAVLVGEIVIGLLIALVVTFFLLRDGDRIWDWALGLVGDETRVDMAEVGRRSWATLGGYLRGITLVALFDAVFIGVALVILGVPAALPLAVLTFFGAYIPIAGAVITGLAAVLVALVANGPLIAGAVAAAVLVVQQVESNVLHPVVVGRAVALHPLATLLAVAAGALIAGIPGAIVAVPITAVAARAASYLRGRRDRTKLEAAPAVPGPSP